MDRRDGGVVAAGQSEPGASGTAGAMGADAYVASTHSEGAATASPTRPGGRGPPGRQGSVDVLRLSQVVRENLEREEGGAEYRSSLNVDNSDIQLDNPDAELDFSTAPQPGVGGEEAQDVETAPCPEAEFKHVLEYTVRQRFKFKLSAWQTRDLVGILCAHEAKLRARRLTVTVLDEAR